MRHRSPEPRTQAQRTERSAVSLALVISLCVHVTLVLVLARWVTGANESRGSPFGGEPLRATLTTPAQRFAVPENAIALDAQSTTSASGQAEAGLPAPERRAAASGSGSSVYGQVVVNLLGNEEPVDPQMQQVIEQIYPGAVRAMPELEAMPKATYPDAALKDRRNAHVVVLVVVLEDGSVELAQGTYDDPLFAPSIKAALAGAQAQPAIVDGQPRPSWSPMSFTFEVVGGP